MLDGGDRIRDAAARRPRPGASPVARRAPAKVPPDGAADGRARPAAALESAPARAEGPAALRALRHRHLLGIQGLASEEITLILDTARAFAEVSTRAIKKVPTLRGKTVVNFFMEPSTRT